jgi:tRNA pseudouridine55 synthase
MGSRKRGRDVHAVFLLDKPAGLSSNQALQKVRRLLDARKAGHTGTLDPFATGMLPICLGEASKTAGYIVDGRKEYQATLKLGQATTTGDLEGEVVSSQPVPALESPAIEAAMQKFLGPQLQVPPMHSAIKRDGRPLYELARQGIVVEREPRSIEIFRFKLLSWQPPLLEFLVSCSKGTYIRTLAEDLSRVLGTCGHLQALRRTGVEPFEALPMYTLVGLEQAVHGQRAEDMLLPADAGLPAWPVIDLQDEEAGRFLHGNVVPGQGVCGKVRVHATSPTAKAVILGLGEVREGGVLHPLRVFAPGVSIRPFLGL